MTDPDVVQTVEAALAGEWVVLYQGRYWGPNRGGYALSLLNAGLYSEVEAKQIESGSDRGDIAEPALGEFQMTRDNYTREGTLIHALLLRLTQAEARNVALVARWERLKAWLSTAITMAQPEVYAITHKMASLERPTEDAQKGDA